MPGLRGRPLVALRQRDLVAWATDTADTDWTREDLLAHHAIVEAIFAAADACLPARFGTPVAADLLTQRYADLMSALARVAGRAELAVTATWARPHEPTTSGTAYLRARAHALNAAEHVAQELERTIGEDLVEAQHRLTPSDTVALSSALLVSRAKAETVKSRLPRQMQDVRILVNGPWPAYSFAAVGGSPNEA